MSEQGYYRFPTIHGETVVFVCEDDLWTVPAGGGVARRLTSGVGAATTPFLSPDGRWLAFAGREEGNPEVYVMPAEGGPSRRLTFQGASMVRVAGWSRDGRSILYTSNAAQPMQKMHRIFSVPRAGGEPSTVPCGRARFISYGARRGVVIGRNALEPAWWKRYRGGTAGQLWIDRSENGRFERLIQDVGNPSNPMWIGGRIFFHADHEGIGNLYSCTPEGKDLRRHTRHEDFYVRHPSTDGRRIVYAAGGDLHLLDPASERPRRIEVGWHSPRTQRARRFVDTARYLEDFAVHPSGRSLAITARGKVFTFASWEGAVVQHGEAQGVRYRLARWLHDGKRLVAASDEGGEESLVVFSALADAKPVRLGRLEIGRAVDMAASPRRDEIVIANHRHELVHVDLRRRRARILDRSEHARIAGLAWSPDGEWVAYGFQETPHTGMLRLARVRGGKPVNVTRAVARDVAPFFDPEGRYLYFLSYREFDPIYDALHFDLGFPRGMRPYLVTLRKDLKSPFVPEPKETPKDAKPAAKPGKARPDPLRIDLAGIEERVVPFPVPDGRYGQVAGIKGAAIFTSFPIPGSLGTDIFEVGAAASGALEIYRFEEPKRETIVSGISEFDLSRDGSTLLYRVGRRLRAIKAGEKPDEKAEKDPPSRRSGWIDLSRARVLVDPGAEWRQMFREAWRLMRDHFWSRDMCGVDWKAVLGRYLPLVDRVACRSEFSDLVWEMQGETGTSHCYEMGGDYRPEPRYDVGFLGADFSLDRRTGGWRVERIVRGDPWSPKATSPLLSPGMNVKSGDVIVAVNGRRLSRELPPSAALVHLARQEVTLRLASGRTVTVKTLAEEHTARYRDWVEANRAFVHRRSGGRIGYVHIPDMGPLGFSEFHRQYLAEVDRDALLVDVRYNGGGHVSPLLLEKLARKRLGYDVPRWGRLSPYPGDSPAGPMIALTNEYAGSDGDIFSHCFKLMKLGPLVGKRTWGGVVGIWPRHTLVDGAVTTQPEFSFWFKDVGFGVENYGTDPDVEIDVEPHDEAAGKDPQLERTVGMLLDLLKGNPALAPDVSRRPDLSLPKRLRKA